MKNITNDQEVAMIEASHNNGRFSDAGAAVCITLPKELVDTHDNKLVLCQLGHVIAHIFRARIPKWVLLEECGDIEEDVAYATGRADVVGHVVPDGRIYEGDGDWEKTGWTTESPTHLLCINGKALKFPSYLPVGDGISGLARKILPPKPITPGT